MSTPTSPYAEAHNSPQGSGDARPTALQIIQDLNIINAFPDKVILVTGASSGIGIDTAAALYATGAHVFMAVRDMVKGEGALKEILDAKIEGDVSGSGKLELLKMDLGDLGSVRTGVEEFLKRSGGKLNVLVNNAGIRNPPEGRTKDGFEIQIGTNHFGPFLLTRLLLPTLLSSSTPNFNSRVINVSSGAHRASPMHFDNLNLEGIYDPRVGYSQSKTANILMANQLEVLYGKHGVHALSVHPGMILSGAQRYENTEDVLRRVRERGLERFVKSRSQGAATTVWGAVAPVWEGKGGVYLEDCKEGVEVEGWNPTEGGYSKHAFDEDAAKRLWEVSCELVGVGAEI